MLALVLAASLSAADVPAPQVSPAISDNTTEARLLFLTERLHAGETAAGVWFWSWTAIYAAGTIGQGIGFFLSQDLRGQVNWAVGAATTLLGLILMLVTDFPAEYATRALNAMPSGTPEERAAKLKRAEKLMEDASEAELFGRAWYIHVGGAVVALAGGLILWAGYGFLLDGIINLVGGVVLSEVQIWTQPSRATQDLAEYRARFGLGAGPSKPSVRLVPMLGGLAVAGAF